MNLVFSSLDQKIDQIGYLIEKNMDNFEYLEVETGKLENRVEEILKKRQKNLKLLGDDLRFFSKLVKNGGGKADERKIRMLRMKIDSRHRKEGAKKSKGKFLKGILDVKWRRKKDKKKKRKVEKEEKVANLDTDSDTYRFDNVVDTRKSKIRRKLKANLKRRMKEDSIYKIKEEPIIRKERPVIQPINLSFLNAPNIQNKTPKKKNKKSPCKKKLKKSVSTYLEYSQTEKKYVPRRLPTDEYKQMRRKQSLQNTQIFSITENSESMISEFKKAKKLALLNLDGLTPNGKSSSTQIFEKISFDENFNYSASRQSKLTTTQRTSLRSRSPTSRCDWSNSVSRRSKRSNTKTLSQTKSNYKEQNYYFNLVRKFIRLIWFSWKV